MAQQKGQTKPGRNKRVPSNARYLGERRWERNKRLAKERHERRCSRQKEKRAAWGARHRTARSMRRLPLQRMVPA